MARLDEMLPTGPEGQDLKHGSHYLIDSLIDEEDDNGYSEIPLDEYPITDSRHPGHQAYKRKQFEEFELANTSRELENPNFGMQYASGGRGPSPTVGMEGNRPVTLAEANLGDPNAPQLELNPAYIDDKGFLEKMSSLALPATIPGFGASGSMAAIYKLLESMGYALPSAEAFISSAGKFGSEAFKKSLLPLLLTDPYSLSQAASGVLEYGPSVTPVPTDYTDWEWDDAGTTFAPPPVAPEDPKKDDDDDKPFDWGPLKDLGWDTLGTGASALKYYLALKAADEAENFITGTNWTPLNWPSGIAEILARAGFADESYIGAWSNQENLGLGTDIYKGPSMLAKGVNLEGEENLMFDPRFTETLKELYEATAETIAEKTEDLREGITSTLDESSSEIRKIPTGEKGSKQIAREKFQAAFPSVDKGILDEEMALKGDISYNDIPIDDLLMSYYYPTADSTYYDWEDTDITGDWKVLDEILSRGYTTKDLNDLGVKFPKNYENLRKGWNKGGYVRGYQEGGFVEDEYPETLPTDIYDYNQDGTVDVLDAVGGQGAGWSDDMLQGLMNQVTGPQPPGDWGLEPPQGEGGGQARLGEPTPNYNPGNYATPVTGTGEYLSPPDRFDTWGGFPEELEFSNWERFPYGEMLKNFPEYWEEYGYPQNMFDFWQNISGNTWSGQPSGEMFPVWQQGSISGGFGVQPSAQYLTPGIEIGMDYTPGEGPTGQTQIDPYGPGGGGVSPPDDFTPEEEFPVLDPVYGKQNPWGGYGGGYVPLRGLLR